MGLGFLTAILNRIRGSGLVNISHTVKRIILALVMAGYVYWQTGNAWTLTAAPLIWGGLTPGWGQWWHVDTLYKFAMMSLRGLLVTAPAGVLLFYLQGVDLAFALSGSAMGVCYKFGWKIPSTIPQLRQGPEVGEFLFGAVIGFSLYLSL